MLSYTNIKLKMKPLSEQEIVRREKLQKLRELGIDPYPAKTFEINTNSKKINENFEEEKKVFIAGRIMSRRIQGKASFAELQDNFGKVQLYFNRDEICIGENKTKYNEIYKKLDTMKISKQFFNYNKGIKIIENSLDNKKRRKIRLGGVLRAGPCQRWRPSPSQKTLQA